MFDDHFIVVFGYNYCSCGAYVDDGMWKKGSFYCMSCADDMFNKKKNKVLNQEKKINNHPF